MSGVSNVSGLRGSLSYPEEPTLFQECWCGEVGVRGDEGKYLKHGLLLPFRAWRIVSDSSGMDGFESVGVSSEGKSRLS